MDKSNLQRYHRFITNIVMLNIMSHQRYFMFFGLLLYQFYNRKTVKNKKYSENISEYPTLWPEKFYNKKLSVIYHIFPLKVFVKK
jgi:hypothetical protein